MSTPARLSLHTPPPVSRIPSSAHRYAAEHDAWQGVMALGASTAVVLSVLPILRFGSISGKWQAFVLSVIFSAVLCGLFLGASVSLLSGVCSLFGKSRALTSLSAALFGAVSLGTYVAWRAPLELSRVSVTELLPSLLGSASLHWGMWLSIGVFSLGVALLSFRLLRSSFRAPLCARPLLLRGAFSAVLLLSLIELLGQPSVAARAPLQRTADLALLSALQF